MKIPFRRASQSAQSASVHPLASKVIAAVEDRNQKTQPVRKALAGFSLPRSSDPVIDYLHQQINRSIHPTPDQQENDRLRRLLMTMAEAFDSSMKTIGDQKKEITELKEKLGRYETPRPELPEYII